MSSIQNLSYKPYTDNAAGKVNIIPFQGKEFARADAGTRINAKYDDALDMRGSDAQKCIEY